MTLFESYTLNEAQVESRHFMIRVARSGQQDGSAAMPGAGSYPPIPKHVGSEHFVKGPIPLFWLKHALAVNGAKSGHLACALWYRAGLNGGKNPVTLTTTVLEEFGLTSSTVRRLLVEYESHGLVRVEVQPGRARQIVLLDPRGQA